VERWKGRKEGCKGLEWSRLLSTIKYTVVIVQDGHRGGLAYSRPDVRNKVYEIKNENIREK